MTEDEYLSTRLEDQIKWYSKKGGINKKRYHTTMALTIVLSALIPLVAGLSQAIGEFTNYITGCMGVGVTILSSLMALYKYQEKWSSYRTTGETLKHEKYLYLTKTQPYTNAKTAFPLLVQRVENLISEENSVWNEVILKKEEEQ